MASTRDLVGLSIWCVAYEELNHAFTAMRLAVLIQLPKWFEHCRVLSSPPPYRTPVAGRPIRIISLHRDIRVGLQENVQGRAVVEIDGDVAVPLVRVALHRFN